MGKNKGGPNQKAVVAAEKKGAAQSVKDAKAAAADESKATEDWNKGANTRGQSKAESAAAKADDAARKRAKKAALFAEEESTLDAGVKSKKTPVLSKKGKTKKKDDLSLLGDALVGAADKKFKAKRQADRAKEQKLKKEAEKKKEEEKPLDPLLANTNAMIAGTEDDLVGRSANRASMAENAGSGINGALDSLQISGGPQNVPSAKALFKAFEERMLTEVKEDYPGLKLSQYKEKIFQMWKKSKENPSNQAP